MMTRQEFWTARYNEHLLSHNEYPMSSSLAHSRATAYADEAVEILEGLPEQPWEDE
jgi:hypothetical protein